MVLLPVLHCHPHLHQAGLNGFRRILIILCALWCREPVFARQDVTVIGASCAVIIGASSTEAHSVVMA